MEGTTKERGRHARMHKEESKEDLWGPQRTQRALTPGDVFFACVGSVTDETKNPTAHTTKSAALALYFFLLILFLLAFTHHMTISANYL
jgi:hypothetical protein